LALVWLGFSVGLVWL